MFALSAKPLLMVKAFLCHFTIFSFREVLEFFLLERGGYTRRVIYARLYGTHTLSLPRIRNGTIIAISISSTPHKNKNP